MSTPTVIAASPAARTSSAPQTALGILSAISLCHLLNDLMQSVVPAVYPILKESYALDFGQIGLITFANQATASLLQPIVGRFTDAKPKPYSLAVGMTFTLVGLLLLSLAPTFGLVLAAVACVGIGSSIFHPESSRVARMASGGRHGFAQSFFQVGGNAGSAMGPLLAAFIVLPRGQGSIAWFALTALIGIAILARVGAWYQHHLPSHTAAARQTPPSPVPAATVRRSLAILVALVFSKNVYLASLTSFYTFYLINKFGLSVQSAQLHLFILLAAVAAGTFFGGPVGDRIGASPFWVSILGVLPFTVALPYANLFWTELFRRDRPRAGVGVPGDRGVRAGAGAGAGGDGFGIFFGFAFGAGAIGAALLGHLADATSIELVYTVCSFLPAIGLLTVFLPDIEPAREAGKSTALAELPAAASALPARSYSTPAASAFTSPCTRGP